MLVISDLQVLPGDLWHYISHQFGDMRKLQAEAMEQLGHGSVRAGDDAQAQQGGVCLRGGSCL